MTTVAQVINRAKRPYLLGSQPEAMNKLAQSMSDSTSNITLEYPLGQATAGQIVAIGLEECLIWEASTPTKSLTVQRGHNGTTPTTHDADDLVYVAPQYSPAAILDAINIEINDLSGEIPAIKHVEFNNTGITDTFNLDVDDLIQVRAVYYDTPDLTGGWPRLTTAQFDVNMNADPETYASGYSLTLNIGLPMGYLIRVAYTAPLSSLTTLEQDVELVTGIQATAVDILSIGAAARLSTGGVQGRVQYGSQGDTRRPEEVTAGDVVRSSAYLWDLRQRRIVNERRIVNRRYGYGIWK